MNKIDLNWMTVQNIFSIGDEIRFVTITSTDVVKDFDATAGQATVRSRPQSPVRVSPCYPAPVAQHQRCSATSLWRTCRQHFRSLFRQHLGGAGLSARGCDRDP